MSPVRSVTYVSERSNDNVDVVSNRLFKRAGGGDDLGRVLGREAETHRFFLYMQNATWPHGYHRICAIVLPRPGWPYTVLMATTAKDRITKTPGVCGGRACIAGHRVRVLDVVEWHEHQGMTPDQIVSEVPSLTLADVH